MCAIKISWNLSPSNCPAGKVATFIPGDFHRKSPSHRWSFSNDQYGQCTGNPYIGWGGKLYVFFPDVSWCFCRFSQPTNPMTGESNDDAKGYPQWLDGKRSPQSAPSALSNLLRVEVVNAVHDLTFDVHVLSNRSAVRTGEIRET